MTIRATNRNSAMARIREFWPVIRLLRSESLSWRKLPEHMHTHFGLPRVSHVCYIHAAHEMEGNIMR